MPRKRRRRPPDGVFPAVVEDLAQDGRGVSRIDGKAVFIHGALPQEQVTFQYDATHSQFDEGRVESVVAGSTDRVEPNCDHFGLCGGCALQHLDPLRQIEYKQHWLLESLQRIGGVSPDEVLPPLTGPHLGYRHKARLGVKFVTKKERVLVGFRERNAPYVADLVSCGVLAEPIGGMLPALAELIGGLSIYNRLPQIEVAVGDDTAALSFRVLDPPSEADRALLTAFGRDRGIHIYLQPKGPATTCALWPENPEPLGYTQPAFDLELQFLPYHFTQVNPAINRQMVSRAVDLLDLRDGDRVLDLFCGLGNFSLALARRAEHVVGVEGEKSLVDWAAANARHNAIDNAEFQVADLAAELPTGSWLDRPYDKALLDPPRSGALAMMPVLARLAPARLVYVSCHPATLARDAGLLVQQGYRLASAGVMDMFPHTAHVESIALFIR